MSIGTKGSQEFAPHPPCGFPVHAGPGFEIAVADWIVAAQAIPDDSVNLVVTSVPYWALRDYQVEGQLGLEASLGLWLKKLVDGFREIRRILHPSGTLWVNCGDSYAQGGRGAPGVVSLDGGRRNLAAGRAALEAMGDNARRVPEGFKPKDLLMQPARLAIALCEDGWYLRQEVVWSKPNPMPESIKDRPTKSHEMIYMLSKSRTYFYDADAVREPYKPESIARRKYVDVDVGERRASHQPGASPQRSSADIARSVQRDATIAPGRSEGDKADFAGFRGAPAARRVTGEPGHTHGLSPSPTDHEYVGVNPAGRNRRDVWTAPGHDQSTLWAAAALALEMLSDSSGDLGTVLDIPTARFDGGHTATYPPNLIEPIIKAGTSERGVCPKCRAPWKRVIERGDVDADWAKACGADAQGGYQGSATKPYEETGAQNPAEVKARILAGMRTRRTTGWMPTCGCSPDEKHLVEYLRSGSVAFFAIDHARKVTASFIDGPEGRDVGCADPTCTHQLSTHGPSMDACGRCKCSAFRWGDPYEPVPAVVYDPFSGMATTELVARRLGRHAMGSELSPTYAEESVRRLQQDDLVRAFGDLAKNGTEAEKKAAASQGRLF